MGDAKRDNNRVTGLIVEDSLGNHTIVPLVADDETSRLLVNSTITGNINVISPVTTIADGRKVVTTAGTRVTLAASTTPCKKVDIVAEIGNTGVVVVGGSTVVASASTRRGVPLEAGDAYCIEFADLVNIYIDSTVNGEGITFTYYV